MTNDKEREKAKQKNIAVIENAIAARNKYKSIADDRVREIAKLEKQIVSLEALLDNRDGADALKIKLAECEGTIAALRSELASVRGRLDKKSKASEDISSSNALSKLAQLAGSTAGLGSGFSSRDYLVGVLSGVVLVGALVSVSHHRNGGTVSLRWFGETVSALLKTSTAK